VLRVEPAKEDQAESAILELVDGPKDMRFALTAQTVARDRMLGTPHTEITKLNMEKVGRYRGLEAFEEQVSRFVEMERNGQKGTTDPEMKEKVYSKGLRDNR
jgi:large subunit ribosomal protein L17